MSTTIMLDTREGFDKITDVQKITSGYFSDDDGNLYGGECTTGSINSSNHSYYAKVVQTGSLTKEEFAITFGHYAGSCSNTAGGTEVGQTQAVYKQFSNMLLGEADAESGFYITGSSAKTENFYAIVLERDRYKDRVNKRYWTLTLSGSTSDVQGNGTGGASSETSHSGAPAIVLTDDSATANSTATVAGPRYNIVSGSQGVTSSVTDIAGGVYGWFYPDAGIMIFDGAALSASIPGDSRSADIANTDLFTAEAIYAEGVANYKVPLFDSCSYQGFAVSASDASTDQQNHLRMFNCLSSGSLTLRDEEDQTTISYFCRVKAGQMNFSNNPTFVSGSANEIRHKTFWGNPTTYITGVGLYSSAGQLVAVAKLSKPVKKNFSTEATIKVKLTY